MDESSFRDSQVRLHVIHSESITRGEDGLVRSGLHMDGETGPLQGSSLNC